MQRDSFVFYASFYEAISSLPPELQGKCYDAIIGYAIEGKEPEDPEPIVSAVFALVKPQIDANNKRYADGCKGAEHGKKGGRPKKEIEEKTPMGLSEKTPMGFSDKTPNENENENENVNDNENVNEERKGRTSAPRFRKPTREEVKAYCQERGNHVDVDRFFDYYDSNGWKVGKNPMKDWKATIRTWEKNGFDNPRGKPNTYGGSTERANAFDDLEEQLMNELNGGL
jgi:hypothetical protein